MERENCEGNDSNGRAGTAAAGCQELHPKASSGESYKPSLYAAHPRGLAAGTKHGGVVEEVRRR